MDFWQTSKRPNYRRVAVDLVLLLLAGATLFFLAALLVAPFAKLATALSRTSLLEWDTWLLALAVALPAGLAWAFFFVVFEAVKEDLLVTLYGADTGSRRLRNELGAPQVRQGLHQRRRAHLVLRLAPRRRRRSDASSLSASTTRPASTSRSTSTAA